MKAEYVEWQGTVRWLKSPLGAIGSLLQWPRGWNRGLTYVLWGHQAGPGWSNRPVSTSVCIPLLYMGRGWDLLELLIIKWSRDDTVPGLGLMMWQFLCSWELRAYMSKPSYRAAENNVESTRRKKKLSDYMESRRVLAVLMCELSLISSDPDSWMQPHERPLARTEEDLPRWSQPKLKNQGQNKVRIAVSHQYLSHFPLLT